MAIVGNMPPYGDWSSRMVGADGRPVTVRAALREFFREAWSKADFHALYDQEMPPDTAARCGNCNGDGWTQEAECCGNPTRGGECCGSPVPAQVQCEACNGTGVLTQ